MFEKKTGGSKERFKRAIRGGSWDAERPVIGDCRGGDSGEKEMRTSFPIGTVPLYSKGGRDWGGSFFTARKRDNKDPPNLEIEKRGDIASLGTRKVKRGGVVRNFLSGFSRKNEEAIFELKKEKKGPIRGGVKRLKNTAYRITKLFQAPSSRPEETRQELGRKGKQLAAKGWRGLVTNTRGKKL